jgi:hypothetical protein
MLFRLTCDGTARSMAARHARFDPDARALVLPFGVQDIEAPEGFGFEKMSDGYHWTAKGLFDLTGFPPAPPSQPKLTRPRFRDVFDELQAKHRGSRIGVNRGDPFHFVPQLRKLRIIAEAQFARDTLDDLICEALAIALGNCRLFDPAMGEGDDFTLTLAVAVPAAREMVRLAGKLAGASENRVSTDPSWLEFRMAMWAASVALEEAHEAVVSEAAAQAEELGRLLKTFRRGIARVDGNMQRHMTSLRPAAAGTYLLTNWRRLLAPCHREALPWWLDGCIG